MTNEQRINDAFDGVKFENLDEVLKAAEKLGDIEGAEVINWLAKESKNWSYSELFYEIKNIEEVFGAKFELETLINLFFGKFDNWDWSSNLIKEFNRVTRRNITADDVTKNINMDLIIKSSEYNIGLLGFLEFIEANNGNPRLFIEKIASNIDKLTNSEVYDLTCMIDYIKPGDFDMEKIFKIVDWDIVEEYGVAQDFIDFFDEFAPELLPKIPLLS